MYIGDINKFSISEKWNRDQRSNKYANKLQIKEVWKLTNKRSMISYKLSAAYINTKLSADSMLDNNWKTPIVCSKCHVVNDMTILLS